MRGRDSGAPAFPRTRRPSRRSQRLTLRRPESSKRSLVNAARKRAMADKVIAACGGSVRGKKLAILGLTFKPNTDDMREAPSLKIISQLKDLGAQITAYDPEAMESSKR